MGTTTLPIIFFLMVITSTSVNAELQELTASTVTYWRSVLPQTPIPNTIEQLLQPAGNTKHSFEVERAPTVFISYKNAATENQIQNDPNTQLFFLKDSITQGKKMVFDLSRATFCPPFLSLEEASAAPFSSGELPEILELFGIERGSLEAGAVRRALEECEEPPLDGESKRCVTSVEAMVEFVEAELGGGDVRIMETAVTGGGVVAGRQEYVVVYGGPRLVRAQAVVSCHSEPYPRALYYCHKTKHIEIYKVQLRGSNDGISVDAIMSCHTNTSAWNPGYVGFRMLKVKPGTETICHFMPQGNLIFALLPKKDNLMSKK